MVRRRGRKGAGMMGCAVEVRLTDVGVRMQRWEVEEGRAWALEIYGRSAGTKRPH